MKELVWYSIGSGVFTEISLDDMKEFDVRNVVKKELHANVHSFYVKERDVWYVHLGVNVGYEEDGKGINFKRPVVVLKKMGNMFAVLPMTTKGNGGSFYYTLPEKYFGRISRVILSQVRVIDKTRFIKVVASIDKKEFLEIKQKLKALML